MIGLGSDKNYENHNYHEYYGDHKFHNHYDDHDYDDYLFNFTPCGWVGLSRSPRRRMCHRGGLYLYLYLYTNLISTLIDINL